MYAYSIIRCLGFPFGRIAKILLISCLTVATVTGCATYGPYEKEASQLESQLKSDPFDYDALMKLGEINYNVRRYKDAIAYFKRANDIKPDNPDVYYAIGLCMLGRGQYEEVIKYTMEGEQAGATDFRFAYLQGVAYYGIGNYNEAIVSFSRALKIQPKHDLSLYSLGKAFISIGKDSEALMIYNRLKTINPPLAEKLFLEL